MMGKARTQVLHAGEELRGQIAGVEATAFGRNDVDRIWLLRGVVGRTILARCQPGLQSFVIALRSTGRTSRRNAWLSASLKTSMPPAYISTRPRTGMAKMLSLASKPTSKATMAIHRAKIGTTPTVWETRIGSRASSTTDTTATMGKTTQLLMVATRCVRPVSRILYSRMSVMTKTTMPRAMQMPMPFSISADNRVNILDVLFQVGMLARGRLRAGKPQAPRRRRKAELSPATAAATAAQSAPRDAVVPSPARRNRS